MGVLERFNFYLHRWKYVYSNNTYTLIMENGIGRITK